jgi:two-component system, NarL family, nitrate/nitrite response regulator NarL
MLRVLLVSDLRFYREGLQRALSQEPDLEVAGSAASADTALGLVMATGADLVLLDLGVPGGIALVRAIRRGAPGVRVVALGIAETGSAIMPWAEAGIAGYVPRESSLTQLVSTVRSIVDGQSPCAPHVAAALLQRVAMLAGSWPTSREPVSLTAREVEIVGLIERGLTNGEIARTLSIALPTVKNHVHNVLTKLDVQHRWDAPRQLAQLARASES